MAVEQVVMSGADFLSRGWSTGYEVTPSSVAIVCLNDGVMQWVSWDEGEGAVDERCNPDLPLYDTGGALLRAPGPRAAAVVPDPLAEAEAAIRSATTVTTLRAAVLKAVAALGES